jgi:hypothetical protein
LKKIFLLTDVMSNLFLHFIGLFLIVRVGSMPSCGGRVIVLLSYSKILFIFFKRQTQMLTNTRAYSPLLIHEYNLYPYKHLQETKPVERITLELESGWTGSTTRNLTSQVTVESNYIYSIYFTIQLYLFHIF